MYVVVTLLSICHWLTVLLHPSAVEFVVVINDFFLFQILMQGIVSLFVTMYGIMTLAGEFREIRSTVDLESKTWETYRNCPSFYTFNHRGRALSPYYDPPSDWLILYFWAKSYTSTFFTFLKSSWLLPPLSDGFFWDFDVLFLVGLPQVQCLLKMSIMSSVYHSHWGWKREKMWNCFKLYVLYLPCMHWMWWILEMKRHLYSFDLFKTNSLNLTKNTCYNST